MKNDKNTLVKAWIRKADNDLRNAELVINSCVDDCPYDTVCFHCQQAVEKYLKAFLILIGNSQYFELLL